MSLSVEHISAYFRAVGDKDEDEEEVEGDDTNGDENTGRSEEMLKKSKKKANRGGRAAKTRTMRRATRAGVRSAALRRSPCSPRTPRSRSTWWSGR